MITVKERERIARRLNARTADPLIFAVQHRAADTVSKLITDLTEQEKNALLVVLADRCPLPRERPDDGLIDEVAVQRFLDGDPVPLSGPELGAAIRALKQQGHSAYAITHDFNVPWRTVATHFTDQKETAA
ncbi:hypothetical protein [Actinomadura yumaensis]|uniref:Uncharacterized protein n=1 Tax=Actinomadura yumaensis TaxID=111807 RepID=A0ABW2CNV0_9ACTN